jgi:hypothetical protein
MMRNANRLIGKVRVKHGMTRHSVPALSRLECWRLFAKTLTRPQKRFVDDELEPSVQLVCKQEISCITFMLSSYRQEFQLDISRAAADWSFRRLIHNNSLPTDEASKQGTARLRCNERTSEVRKPLE